MEMDLELNIIDSPSEELVNEIRSNLQAFNIEHWETTEKTKHVVELRNGKELLGGLAFTMFGQWQEIHFFWVNPEKRGTGIGKKLLILAEDYAVEKGCKMAGLNTLDFQAKPFYEKHGYAVVYEQKNYPKSGSKFYMEKKLI